MIRALCLLLAIGAVIAARPSPAPAPAAKPAAPPVAEAQRRQSCSAITGCEADGCRESGSREGFVFVPRPPAPRR